MGPTTELLALASSGGLVAGVVGWVDLQAPGVPDALAELKAGPHGGFLCGIRHPVLAEDGDRPQQGTMVAHLVPYYEAVLGAFGPERLMFGSDWPPCTLSATYATVVAAARELTATLGPAEREAVLSGTAQRVYQLKTAG